MDLERRGNRRGTSLAQSTCMEAELGRGGEGGEFNSGSTRPTEVEEPEMGGGGPRRPGISGADDSSSSSSDDENHGYEDVRSSGVDRRA